MYQTHFFLIVMLVLFVDIETGKVDHPLTKESRADTAPNNSILLHKLLSNRTTEDREETEGSTPTDQQLIRWSTEERLNNPTNLKPNHFGFKIPALKKNVAATVFKKAPGENPTQQPGLVDLIAAPLPVQVLTSNKYSYANQKETNAAQAHKSYDIKKEDRPEDKDVVDNNQKKQKRLAEEKAGNHLYTFITKGTGIRNTVEGTIQNEQAINGKKLNKKSEKSGRKRNSQKGKNISVDTNAFKAFLLSIKRRPSWWYKFLSGDIAL